MTRRLVRLSAGVIAALTLLLLVDWAVAAGRKPKDDKLVKDLQEKVKTDAALAPALAAVQKRVTSYRQSRKRRDEWAADGLIAAAIVFLVFARRGLPRHTPAPPVKATRAHGAGDRHACRCQPAAAADAIDLAFVDETVARIGRNREAAIPLLQAIQTHYRYLPDEALRRLCEITDITPAQISGTSSFYGQFRRSPVGEHIVKVCHGTACHVAGARQVTDELRRYLDIPEGQDTDASRQFTLEEVACLGCCSLAPVLMVDEQTAGRLTPNTASAALRPFEKETA
jgi:NADH:ubiquinone oxidoreductase subunit E